jgi:hypothetical protein
MKKTILIALLLTCGMAFGQHKKGPSKPKTKAYNSADYPADQYSTRTDTGSLGAVKLQTIHVLSKGLTSDPVCKAWLIIRKGNKSTANLFYDDIMTDNGTAGVLFPKKQPREDLFIAMKFGDFDGRLIVVDREGQANSVPGGNFYVSEDNKYLFTNYESDQTGLTVLDLDKNDEIFADSSTLDSKLGQWYYQDDKFFAISLAEPKEDADTTQITIATLDMKKKKIIFSQVDKTYPEKDNKLQFYSYYDKPENKGNCACGKR